MAAVAVRRLLPPRSLPARSSSTARIHARPSNPTPRLRPTPAPQVPTVSSLLPRFRPLPVLTLDLGFRGARPLLRLLVRCRKASHPRRRLVPFVLLSITGGVALSAVNDLAVFHGCSSKAIEKASKNPKVVEALGEPIVRGPWYDASLAVGHRRHSVSCTFPVSGPQGTGVFQIKAIRTGEDTWLSFLRHHDWDIVVMEAHVRVPSNDEKNQTFRISVLDSNPIPTMPESKERRSPQSEPSMSEECEPH